MMDEMEIGRGLEGKYTAGDDMEAQIGKVM
jgi:hypothetical protein